MQSVSLGIAFAGRAETKARTLAVEDAVVADLGVTDRLDTVLIEQVSVLVMPTGQAETRR